MSSRRIFHAVRRIHERPVWADGVDTPAILREWMDAKDLSLEPSRRHPHALSLERLGTSPRRARRAFLERWRDGLRWQGFVLVLAAFVLLALPARGESPQQTFEKANQAYQQQRWDAAAEGYRALVARGVDNADVWYDLGNAYVHLDDYGRARACLERARRLSPRDPDIRADLAVLRDKLADKTADEDGLGVLARSFTPNELAVTGSVLWLLTALLFAAWLKGRREALAWLAGLSLGLLLCVAALFALQMQHRDEAVVIPSEVRLYNGPGRDFAAGITLHAGARVDVLEAQGDWREVAAFGKVKGWLRGEQVEKI
jgi:tetratricopeptide (TPR) repeat protein